GASVHITCRAAARIPSSSGSARRTVQFHTIDATTPPCRPNNDWAGLSLPMIRAWPCDQTGTPLAVAACDRGGHSHARSSTPIAQAVDLTQQHVLGKWLVHRS